MGMEPERAVTAAKKLGIQLNEYGFCATDRLAPLSTSRPGVFVGGLSRSRKTSRKR